ncbi:MAG: hypothetical protein QM757_04755 [Paludibaculum sp.]
MYERPLLFSSSLKKARKFLQDRGVQPGIVQSDGGTEFFELQDLEGNTIEVCKEQ